MTYFQGLDHQRLYPSTFLIVTNAYIHCSEIEHKEDSHPERRVEGLPKPVVEWV